MNHLDWPLAAALVARDPDDPAYRVFVRDLVLAVSIGIHAHEKRQRARIRINADILVDLRLPERDDFGEALDYETIVAGIKALADGKHINLVETLADRVAALCLADPRARAVRVTVEKLDIYPEAQSVGVMVERCRPGS
ncbi:MAG TPA: dihydroneopterin aldolase [Stellaceae bacterium]|nr:dihydroneopterin aldolase [Stellaceae bacterium]